MRQRLIIIEDSPDNLEILRLFVENDFDVAGFSSATEALEKIEDIAPDLLLMDIALPGMDGIECLQRIRSIPRFTRTPAIAVTAFAYSEDKRRLLAGGFQAVVVKPIVDHNELRRTIEHTLIGSSNGNHLHRAD